MKNQNSRNKMISWICGALEVVLTIGLLIYWPSVGWQWILWILVEIVVALIWVGGSYLRSPDRA